MKRGVEANTLMYLALTRICFNEWLNMSENNAVVVNEIKSQLQEIKKVAYDDHPTFQAFHNNMLEKFESIYIFSNFESFRNSLKNQGKFFNNYMKMVETLLLFIRSSTEGLWNLHLASLNDFTKYFFAHDQINYARLSPVYVASMLQLQHSDHSTWEYLEEISASIKTVFLLNQWGQIMRWSKTTG